MVALCRRDRSSLLVLPCLQQQCPRADPWRRFQAPLLPSNPWAGELCCLPAPCADGPVDDERYAATAPAVKGQVEALVQKFRAFAFVPSTGGTGEGDATQEGAPLAGAGGVQG